MSEESVGGLTAFDRHVLRRFTFGLNRGTQKQVAKLGGALAWFEWQLDPGHIKDTRAKEVAAWYPDIWLTPQQMWAKFVDGRKVTVTSASEDFVRWTLQHQIRTRRQVKEVMTDFWSNHFHVPSPNDKCWVWRTDYDQVIRRHALGRFDELLEAAVLHPAMLLYLDNYANDREACNENLGRELLELHTVGRGAGYTEREVVNSAWILTGWAVDRGRTWQPRYTPSWHRTGRLQVMDFEAANADPDGREVTKDYLRYLAHHPATAQRIALKLARRFVSDDPPAQLVDDLAAVFRNSGTDISATLRALIRHPLFVTGSKPKVRTPAEDYVATCRALRVKVQQPVRRSDLGTYCIWQTVGMGQRPFNWPTPDGFPDASDAWASASRMLGSWNVHQMLATRRPEGAAEFKPYDFWAPEGAAPFGEFVRSVCATLLFEVPDDRVVTAAAQAVGVHRDTLITRDHAVVTQRMGLLLSCLLDSPLHLTR